MAGYHVRGVDGSCAKYLTARSSCGIISIPHPSLFHSRLPSFSANPSHRSLPFFLRTDYMDSPDCLLLLPSISVYYFLVFLFYTF